MSFPMIANLVMPGAGSFMVGKSGQGVMQMAAFGYGVGNFDNPFALALGGAALFSGIMTVMNAGVNKDTSGQQDQGNQGDQTGDQSSNDQGEYGTTETQGASMGGGAGVFQVGQGQ